MIWHGSEPPRINFAKFHLTRLKILRGGFLVPFSSPGIIGHCWFHVFIDAVTKVVSHKSLRIAVSSFSGFQFPFQRGLEIAFVIEGFCEQSLVTGVALVCELGKESMLSIFHHPRTRSLISDQAGGQDRSNCNNVYTPATWQSSPPRQA